MMFKRKLVDLGEVSKDSSLRGIFVEEGFSADMVSKYIHRGFRQDATEYARRYQNVAHFEALLRDALGTRAGWTEWGAPVDILDLGCGAGNTVIPLCRLFPNARVIACDLSVELLMLLAGSLSADAAERVTLVQMNAEELDLDEGSMDLVVGGAILHHLYSPDRTLAAAARILRKGGVALFFEPFETGSILLRIVWARMLSDPRAKDIEPDVRTFLAGMIQEYDLRKGTDKSSEMYSALEDKWLFSREYFEHHARDLGFSNLQIYSLINDEYPFTLKTEVVLRTGIARARDALPAWAWHMVRQHEEYFSAGGRQDLLIEAGVLLRK